MLQLYGMLAFYNHQPHYGHLATVTSSEHNTFIANVIGAVRNDNPEAWIGLNDRCQEGTFTWIDGSSQSYRHWLSGEPNHSGDEDCVERNFRGKGVWNDLSCETKLDFVCS
ncbi:galactose-specific lectin nattectin-like [Rhinoraja longicauda]